MKFPFCLLAVAALTLNAQDTVSYSREKEIALGAALSRQMLRTTTPLDSRTVQDYVATIGRRLAAQFPDTGFHWTFTVVGVSIGGRTSEPAALPGGYLFVPARLLLAAHDESELAGMLAHAMAHVTESHLVRSGRVAARAGQTSIPVIYLGPWASTHAAGNVLAPAGVLESWRALELEADRLAVRILYAAGYDPGALLRYIDREQPAGTDPPPARAALPSHDERIASLERSVRALPPATAPISDRQFQEIQSVIRALTPVEADETLRPRRPPSLYHR